MYIQLHTNNKLLFWENKIKIIVELMIKFDKYNNKDIYIYLLFLANFYKCCNINYYGLPYTKPHIQNIFNFNIICNSSKHHNHCKKCGLSWGYCELISDYIFTNIDEQSIDIKFYLLNINSDIIIDIILDKSTNIINKVNNILSHEIYFNNYLFISDHTDIMSISNSLISSFDSEQNIYISLSEIDSNKSIIYSDDLYYNESISTDMVIYDNKNTISYNLFNTFGTIAIHSISLIPLLYGDKKCANKFVETYKNN
jgi:hypothetical protein